MGALALILGLLGGLCAILGVVTITDLLPPFGAAFTWEFWSTLAIILLLASIASALGRSGGGGYD